MVTLQFKRGPEASIPSLSSGEPGVTTDTEKLFVGMPSGNVEMAKQSDLSALSTTVTEINGSYIPNSQINVPGGVAGLGENGALAIAQGGTGGTTVTQALANLGAQASNNLLVNPRFKYNSRDQQSYSSSGSDVFTVDGWKVQIPAATSASLSLSPQGGVVLTTNGSNQGIKQDVYKENLPNGIYTISILVNGSIFSETFNFSGSSVNEYAGQNFSYAIISASNDSYAVFPLIQYNTTQQSYTITAAKLELGSVSTLQAELDNPPPEDVEKLKLDMYDLDPGRCAYLPWHNENLLDNWYFVGGGSQQGGGQFPINQRGQTEYTGMGGTVDQWKSNSSSTLVSVVPDGISISVNNLPITTQWILNQLLENYSSLAGKTVTVSLALRVTSGSVNVRFYDGTKAYVSQNATSSDLSVISASGTVSDSPTQMAIIVLNQTENADFTLIAAKLELGPRSTLARLVDGEWVLNDPPPNFQQELAKCQRVYQLYSAASLRPSNGNDCRPVMRLASPSQGTIQINGQTWYYNDANL